MQHLLWSLIDAILISFVPVSTGTPHAGIAKKTTSREPSRAPMNYYLRQPPGSAGASGRPSAETVDADQKAPVEDPWILCRDCLHPITRAGERISVDGAHRHTFANPSGMVFEVGCFRRAEGCGTAGPASEEFTWFAGHSWRVCLCAACLAHLGWRFDSRAGHTFHALILDRLIQ
jgi:hypothetical protein